MSEETLIGGQSDNAAEVNAEVNGQSAEESLVGGGAVETSEEGKAEQTEEKEIVYEDFKLPEGYSLNEEAKGEFVNVAKELKLSQDQAQKLVDLQTKLNLSHEEKIQANFKNQVSEWKKESIAELGANYQVELQTVNKAMESFGSPELRKLLNETGLGNHKEVVKFFLNIGKKVSEDSFRDGQGKTEPMSPAQRLYTNTKS